MSKIKTEIELITPQIAKQMLDGMSINRTLRLYRVQQIAAAMMGDDFNGLNGETIIIDEQNRLIDGQHRLNAVVMADVSVKMLVVRGVVADSRDSLDQGLNRTPGDILSFHGHKSVHTLAAAARWLWVYENDWPNGLRSRSAMKVTRAIVLQIVKDNPELELAVAEMLSDFPKCSRLLTGSVGCLIRLVTDRISAAESNEFFAVLESGEGSERTRTIRLLREKLLVRSTRQGRLIPQEIIVLAARVWNAYRSHLQLSRLYVGADLDDPYSNAPRFK